MAVSSNFLVRLNGFCVRNSFEESLLGVHYQMEQNFPHFFLHGLLFMVLPLSQVRSMARNFIGVLLKGRNGDFLFQTVAGIRGQSISVGSIWFCFGFVCLFVCWSMTFSESKIT